MNDALNRLAIAYGIAPSYISERGETCFASDATKCGILSAIGVQAADDVEIATSLASAPQPETHDGAVPGDSRCFMPDWLAGERVWGVTCQLYGLRSARNSGIGDFEDLAQLAELVANAGADFIGVNPLHALFYADAGRYSPYGPSSRRFLNPFYIAVDRLPGSRTGSGATRSATVRATELVDYEQVAHLKRAALEAGYAAFCAGNAHVSNAQTRSFATFCAKRGRPLQQFALYEALSEALVARGYHSGWHTWPAPCRNLDSHAVRRFERENEARIIFHKWLQWVAETQLKHAQQRAKSAGMRLGLYLDLAVGVASDGADTWAQPRTVVDGARIGSPPDTFNDNGQDWGLAPFSPAALVANNFEPFEAILRELMRSAGAVRIDHAMGLTRLYWIPGDARATEGAYVHYPMHEMLRRLALVSQEHCTVVIGEDLGTVPPGFREVMSEIEMQGYRVLYFEREADGTFRSPHAYAHKALACLTTHDLPTLKGWWRSRDVDLREASRLLSRERAAEVRSSRAHDRALLLAVLKAAGLLPSALEPVLDGNAPYPTVMPEDLCVAIHAYLGRAASRLVAVQLEDMVGMQDQANVPGTVNEHPNWRRKLPVDLSEIPNTTLFRSIASVLSQERPRAP
jgi:4-alpha-glucanotransferase